jgi:citrate lyase subunit beta/citryl-CoA lyase
MKPIRSILFVPGHRGSWIDKLGSSEADAVILDLEDSVPPAEKMSARRTSAERIAGLAEAGRRVYVRVNRSAHIYDLDDLLAVVRPGLEGIVLSKPDGPEDVALAAALIGEAEHRNGFASGAVLILPALETPRGLQFAYECALHPRVIALMGASAKGADLAGAMGFEWTEGGRESLYLKSRVVMAARAAGKLPIGGLWQQVHDLEGLKSYAEQDRGLGMAGQAILHPSNAAVVNAVFSPSPETLARYREMVLAYEQAQAKGLGSVMFNGEHIDKAHVETARAILTTAGQA